MTIITPGADGPGGLSTFPSNFWMIFLPPFRAICSASSSLPLMSLIWASRPFFTLSRWRVCSCSRRSSSPTRAN